MAAQKTIYTSYTTVNFNNAKALAGDLCIVVNSDTGTGTTVKSNDSTQFFGANTCKKDSSGNLKITYDGETYIFTSKGEAYSSNAVGKKLMLASIGTSRDSQAGGAIKSKFKTRVEVSESGAEYIDTREEESDVLIDTLMARDQFAIHALKGIMYHLEDPSSISESAMINYSKTAYQWAEAMMIAAADVRAVYENEGGEETITPESSTDKILLEIKESIDGFVESLSGQLEEIRSDVNDAKSSIEDIGESIEGIEENIESIDGKIENLDERVTALEEENE